MSFKAVNYQNMAFLVCLFMLMQENTIYIRKQQKSKVGPKDLKIFFLFLMF